MIALIEYLPRPGQAKNTYGTGCFLLLNTGSEACESTHGLVTTIAAAAPGEGPVYALEGSVFMAGAYQPAKFSSPWARQSSPIRLPMCAHRTRGVGVAGVSGG